MPPQGNAATPPTQENNMINTSNYSNPSDIPAVVRATALVTAGHLQLVVKCPNCGGLHRHMGPGVRRGACGALYVVPPRRERAQRSVA